MNKVGFMQKATGVVAAAVAMVTTMSVTPAQAQTSNTIFPAGWDHSVRDRMFMRLSYIKAITKTQSGDAYDVTGPVLRADELDAIAAHGDALLTTDELSSDNFDRAGGLPYASAMSVLKNALVGPYANGVGTPRGIKAKAGNPSPTVALSLGYWLTDEYDWSVEAFLMAAPLRVKAYGDGLNESGNPNGLNGKEILTTKMLPPLAIVGRSFFSPSSPVRPFLGIGAMYALFYDTKVTQNFTNYLGRGNTHATLKNTVGVGPFIGLRSRDFGDWHINFSVGQIKLKTEATLTTSRSQIVTGAGVLQDFPVGTAQAPLITGAINFSETGNYKGIVKPSGGVDNNFTTKLMQVAAEYKTGDRNDLGTFVRKQSQVLTNTIFVLSVGHTF